MTFELGGLCPLLQVYDMPASLAFYRDALGFELVERSAGDRIDWCLLKQGGAWLMLNTAYETDEERPVPPDPGRMAAHDDTSLFIEARDLDAIHAHLAALGLAGAPPHTAPYGMRQLYVRDPDGYSICFQHPA
jgi:catechol 2,3-dioxygenase-like lactoylglutathione lyase family enzyme